MRIRRCARWVVLVTVLAVQFACAAQSSVRSAPLPVDQSVEMFTLPNGMRCWVRHNETPPDRVGIWLHVGSGSMNEQDDERGLAHYLEHMAFRGSENFPPDTLVKYFESIGLTFGRDQNAFTAFDRTNYEITLPDTEEETIRKGLLCMSDFAYRLTLHAEEVDKERGVILEEKRSRKGPGQRVYEALLPVLLPGSLASERIVIGKEEVIEAATRGQLAGYYRKWYRPDNSVLLVVGDVDPQAMPALVEEAFGDWPTTGNPTPNADAGIEPYQETRADTITDAEVPETNVVLASVRPVEPLQTEADFRRELVDDIGTWLMNRRLGEMVQKGTAPFQRAGLSKYTLWNMCTYIEAETYGAPEKSIEMLESLVVELKRGREHGFLEQELGDARKAILAAAERAAETEETWNSNSFLRHMERLIEEGRKPMAAAQGLELTRRFLDGITLQEVTDAFRSNFSNEARLLLVIMPKKDDLPVPTDDVLLAAAAMAEAQDVAPLEAKERPQSLLAEDPEPGRVVEQEEEPDLQILSVTLDNGVRAHLRSMDFKKDEVLAVITLPGAVLRETPGSRGLTAAATLAFLQPATPELSSTDIRDLMTGKKVGVSGSFGTDAVTLSISGSPEDLEDGFRLAHVLLMNGMVEEAALARWIERTAQDIERRRTSVDAQLVQETSALLTGGDFRLRYLTQEQVDGIGLADAQRWLDRLLRSSPIEVSVVGDIDRDRALQLVLKYIGSLPKRPSVVGAFDKLREIKVNKGPIIGSVDVETETPRAVMQVGWRGADWTDVKDRRVLQIAARILSTRLREEIREKRGLSYSPYCSARPAQTFPGAGMFAAYMTLDPAKAEEMVTLTREVIEQFAKEGPTEEELSAVRLQFANSIETSQKKPGYWAGVLSDLDYRGTVLADVKEAMEKYTTYTRDDMMDVLGRYVTEERRIQVVVLPVMPPGVEEEAEELEPVGAGAE